MDGTGKVYWAGEATSRPDPMPLIDHFSPERRSLARLRAGDLEGLKWVYETFAERLLNQCWRILLSKEQAEDVVQDLFIRLPGLVSEFRGESALGTWLYRVAHNMCLTRLQQGRNRARLEEENLAGESDPGRDGYEVSDLLGKALAVLDPETRSLLWLKEGEGMPLKELSEAFKLPEGTLKSRLSRARDRVREFLEKEENVGKP
jgi:RNA polymerase sigma-70 factor (ECF subfamily)